MADQVQVFSKTRFLHLRGMIGDEIMILLNQALLIALDLPGQA